jgi:hypothetical protein
MLGSCLTSTTSVPGVIGFLFIALLVVLSTSISSRRLFLWLLQLAVCWN